MVELLILMINQNTKLFLGIGVVFVMLSMYSFLLTKNQLKGTILATIAAVLFMVGTVSTSLTPNKLFETRLALLKFYAISPDNITMMLNKAGELYNKVEKKYLGE